MAKARAYYNEFDPFAANWLRALIKKKLIAPGDVDERSIEDVLPSDLKDYNQCHFFAGIGGWSHSLRLAGWADDRPAWSGSCPCQPFSTAGNKRGETDERHLWPALFWLLCQCRPVVVFGEQVEAALRLNWLDHVAGDLEGVDYTVGAVISPACGFGAPHVRQRLYWLAHSNSVRFPKDFKKGIVPIHRRHNISKAKPRSETNGFWANADWIRCKDARRGPVEPGVLPLAYGVSEQMGRVRGYGNAIVPPQASEFVKAYMAELSGN